MGSVFDRIWQNMVGRITGPMHFRLILQPAMAMIFAIRDGVRDAHRGEPAYFWPLCPAPARRSHHLRTCWNAVRRVFILAAAMDVIYQIIELHRFYPGEALLVAASLAIVPYFLLRGPVNRVIQHRIRRKTQVISKNQ